MQDGFILSLRITKKKRFIIYYVIVLRKIKRKIERVCMYVGVYVVCMTHACMLERTKERKRVKEKSYIVVTVYAWVDVIRASTLAIKHATNVMNKLHFYFNFSIYNID